jgi:hypothetical protein
MHGFNYPLGLQRPKNAGLKIELPPMPPHSQRDFFNPQPFLTLQGSVQTLATLRAFIYHLPEANKRCFLVQSFLYYLFVKKM